MPAIFVTLFTSLMKGKVVLYLLLSLIPAAAYCQTYSPMPVTGFTQDIFAESGTSSLATTTTFLDATNHVMYTASFAATNGLNGGVLDNGTFASGTRTYQLAPYTESNAIYLSLNGAIAGTTASSTLALQTPAAFSRISFLSFSTEGTSTLNVVLNFTDGTTSNAGNFTFQDWFSGPNAVYANFGRIARLASPPYTVDGYPTNPRWYAADIPISCDNQAKLLQSVTITYVSQGGTSGRAVALAVSGVSYTPLATSAVISPASCGSPNGSIALTATGGTAPLSYVWNTTPPQFTATASNLPAGTYTATITDANGCTATYQGTVTQTAAITATASASPATICSGDSATLTANTSGNNYTYTWSPGGQTGQSIRVGPADTTTYTVTVQDATGCSTTATVTLPVKKRPLANFTTSPQRFCLRNTDTVSFTGTAGSTATYNWNFGGGAVLSGTGAGPYVLQYATPGSQTITLTVTENGCTSSQATRTITTDAFSQPSFTATPASICSGDTVQVAFTGAAATGATPAWNWGGGTVLSGSGLGPYTVKYAAVGTISLGITNNTCSDTASPKTIMVTPQPTASFSPSATQGCTPLTVSFTNTSQNGTTYSWDFGDNTQSTDQTPLPHEYSSSNNYSVVLTATSGNCTAVSAPQVIRVVDLPTADFSSTPDVASTPLQISQAQFGFTNLSSGATSYKWTFGDNDSSTIANPLHRYTKAGSFTVTLIASNSLGCTDTFSKEPYIIIPDSSLRIPNAFSPNGDGINDRWVIPGLLGYPDCKMEIFDRYGQVVFTNTGYTIPWDGRRNGKDVPIGTYYYVIRTSLRNYSGWVFIVR